MDFHNSRTLGYTLIELVVVIGITSVILVLIVRFVSMSIPLFRSTFVQNMTDETARVQLKRMSDEIRNARSSDTGAFPIAEASPQRIIFYANVDEDSAIERVRYELVGTDLVRGVVNPAGDPLVYDDAEEVSNVVARDIRNGSSSVFSYYGKDYPSDQTLIVPSP